MMIRDPVNHFLAGDITRAGCSIITPTARASPPRITWNMCLRVASRRGSCSSCPGSLNALMSHACETGCKRGTAARAHAKGATETAAEAAALAPAESPAPRRFPTWIKSGASDEEVHSLESESDQISPARTRPSRMPQMK